MKIKRLFGSWTCMEGGKAQPKFDVMMGLGVLHAHNLVYLTNFSKPKVDFGDIQL